MNSPVLQVRLPPPLMEALDAEAEACACTISEVVRRVLAVGLGLGTEGMELPPRRPGPGRGRKADAASDAGADS